jgi:hypothetical protein
MDGEAGTGRTGTVPGEIGKSGSQRPRESGQSPEKSSVHRASRSGPAAKRGNPPTQTHTEILRIRLTCLGYRRWSPMRIYSGRDDSTRLGMTHMTSRPKLESGRPKARHTQPREQDRSALGKRRLRETRGGPGPETPSDGVDGQVSSTSRRPVRSRSKGIKGVYSRQ